MTRPRTGRPQTLPGIIGKVAQFTGAENLAARIGTNGRNLRRWANNEAAVTGISAGLLADACREHGVEPLLFSCGTAGEYVASIPEGWVVFVDYATRSSWIGDTKCLKPANKEETTHARSLGWPW